MYYKQKNSLLMKIQVGERAGLDHDICNIGSNSTDCCGIDEFGDDWTGLVLVRSLPTIALIPE